MLYALVDNVSQFEDNMSKKFHNTKLHRDFESKSKPKEDKRLNSSDTDLDDGDFSHDALDNN